MDNHNQYSDIEFETLFEKGDFPPSLFSHEAHIRLAWLYLEKYGSAGAIERICTQIQQFDLRHGKGDKFNTTVTTAAVKVVHHFKLKSKSEDFTSFLKEFPRLKTAFKALLDQHYGIDIFSNDLARDQFIEPDQLPFD